MNTTIKTVIFWVVIMVSATLLWQVVRNSSTQTQRTPEISYSEFMSRVNIGAVSKVVITGTHAIGTYSNGIGFEVNVPASQDQMLAILQQKGVEIRYTDANNSFSSWLLNLTPLFLLAVLWFYMIRRMQRRKASTPTGPSATSNTAWPQS